MNNSQLNTNFQDWKALLNEIVSLLPLKKKLDLDSILQGYDSHNIAIVVSDKLKRKLALDKIKTIRMDGKDCPINLFSTRKLPSSANGFYSPTFTFIVVDKLESAQGNISKQVAYWLEHSFITKIISVEEPSVPEFVYTAPNNGMTTKIKVAPVEVLANFPKNLENHLRSVISADSKNLSYLKLARDVKAYQLKQELLESHFSSNFIEQEKNKLLNKVNKHSTVLESIKKEDYNINNVQNKLIAPLKGQVNNFFGELEELLENTNNRIFESYGTGNEILIDLKKLKKKLKNKLFAIRAENEQKTERYFLSEIKNSLAIITPPLLVFLTFLFILWPRIDKGDFKKTGDITLDWEYELKKLDDDTTSFSPKLYIEKLPLARKQDWQGLISDLSNKMEDPLNKANLYFATDTITHQLKEERIKLDDRNTLTLFVKSKGLYEEAKKYLLDPNEELLAYKRNIGSVAANVDILSILNPFRLSITISLVFILLLWGLNWNYRKKEEKLMLLPDQLLSLIEETEKNNRQSFNKSVEQWVNEFIFFNNKYILAEIEKWETKLMNIERITPYDQLLKLNTMKGKITSFSSSLKKKLYEKF